jgi:hypothetical protein
MGAFIVQVNAQIRYYLKTNPDELTDDQWADYWQGLVWCRQQEKKKAEWQV